MKHNILRSIAHNISDSLAAGIGHPLIGTCITHIFQEASKSPEKYITVDFLNGTTEGGTPSVYLAEAIKFYRDLLPIICEKQGASIDCFRSLKARFQGPTTFTEDYRVSVTIEDSNGRQSTNEYSGFPLRHLKVRDSLNRIRTKRK